MSKYLPTLQEQGYTRCEHVAWRMDRVLLIGWASLRISVEPKCGWCGARYNGRRWIGGRLDFEPDPDIVLLPDKRSLPQEPTNDATD